MGGGETHPPAASSLVRDILATLEARGRLLAVAESCTGGLLGAAITTVPGASNVFLGGVVAYADSVKVDILGVSRQTLARDGAVSAACAREMARGVRRALGADVALSITGIAGPGGGTREKPVGRVYLGYAAREGEEIRELQLGGDRETIRRKAVGEALRLLARRLGRR